jgi:hypothetical protein
VVLTTEQGWVLDVPDGVNANLGTAPPPASLRIEILGEEGLPQVVVDNAAFMRTLPPVPLPDPVTPPKKAGCQTAGGLSFAVVALLALRFRTRRRG